MESGWIESLLRPMWLIWLTIVFGAILVYAYWPGNRRRFEQNGGIPLRDDQ